MLKNLGFLLSLFLSVANATTSVTTEELRVKSTTIPGSCTGGQLRRDTSTGKLSYCTSSTFGTILALDSNSNFTANSFITGYTTTATSAGTKTLTVADTQQQFFTGVSTHTLKLPVTSTLVLGQKYLVVNNSTGVVTVQSSGANTITAMVGSSWAWFTVIDTSVTTAAGWSASYVPSFLSTNTASTAVIRDASGNFAAGTITAALTGNSSTATALAADPSDCASNTYATTIAASGNLTCASITNASTTAVSTNTNSTIVLRDGSGNFSAGTISAALTGTASGNTTYSANNHGVVISSGTNAMTVIAPDASTTKVLTSGGASADPSWQTATGGSGGGATVQWEEGANAASNVIINNMATYSFGAGLSQNIYSDIKVPAGYSAGTQIKLKCSIYSADSSGTFLMQTISTLLTNNSSLVSSTTNQRTSTNSAITATAGNQNKIQNVAFDLTDASGQINSVAVAANDTIEIQMTRGTDTATGSVIFLYKQCEVTNP